jgi:hypothetical protein
MSEVVGLIEIEDAGYASADFGGTCQDTTLDGLFARLIGRPAVERIDLASLDREPTLVVMANLDLLADDLNSATRDVLAGIFLSFGNR